MKFYYTIYYVCKKNLLLSYSKNLVGLKCSNFLQFVPDFWEGWRCLIYFQADSMVGCWSVILDIVFFHEDVYWIHLTWEESFIGLNEFQVDFFVFQARFQFREIEVSYFSKPCPHQSWCAPVVAAVRIWVRLSGSRSVRSGWVGRSLVLSHNSQGHKHNFTFSQSAFFQNRRVIWVIHTIKSGTIWQWNRWWNCESCHPAPFLSWVFGWIFILYIK